MSTTTPPAIVPAQAGFLAIFNPSLGNTDDTIDDQIVYYSSVDANTQRRRKHRSRTRPTENVSQEERNERLRQIGLAQGMVEFSKSFSGDRPVDTINTEKTHVILHELEPGWWILASIDLTKLTSAPPPAIAPSLESSRWKDAQASQDTIVEYSSREVKPAAIILQDLLRAHAIFLLHHDSSLSALYMRTKRLNFTSILGRYWDLYLSTWNVLLHGNPVRNVFEGIKVAASGELGIGVGEEERGSGEREVLEGLVGRVDGLVDLIVSKFGTDDDEVAGKGNEKRKGNAQEPSTQWVGAANEPAAEDGAVFLGVGALSKKSVRAITYWMEDLYTWGDGAYGVHDSPTATRYARRHRGGSGAHKRQSSSVQPQPAGKKTPGESVRNSVPTSATTIEASPNAEEESGGLDKYMDYLKLGYGKYWSFGGDPGGHDSKESGTLQKNDDHDLKRPSPERAKSKGDDSVGHFLIGLVGEVEEGWIEDPEERRFNTSTGHDDANSRTMLRTLTVELETGAQDKLASEVSKVLGSRDTDFSSNTKSAEGVPGSFDSQDGQKTKKLRVVVYINKPFIFTFLFQLRTESLAWDGLYRSLHHQLAPLRKPLSNSTAYRPELPDTGAAVIYDLVWDPKTMMVHSTIPNIPDPMIAPSSEERAWSRVEALNVHMQILNIYNATRADTTELERTCKTSRGWWIVWNRITEMEAKRGVEAARPSSERSRTSDERASDGTWSSVGEDERAGAQQPTRELVVSKEIFLVRKASDQVRSVSLAAAAGAAGWADGAGRLAQGIGVDTRKYIEGLLSLNR